MNQVVAEKIQDFFDEGVPEAFERDLDLGSPLPPARGNLATVVTGVRRCGKTYRLYQEIRRLRAEGADPGRMLYFNFEDERLKPYAPQLLSDVLDAFFAMRPDAREQGCFLFFDEIQEVPEWGTFLRRVVDTVRATVYVTGSSSRMLSADLASAFRGRAISRELFPMSFSEFARWHGAQVPAEGPAGRVVGSAARDRLRSLLPRYLERGGFVPVQGLAPSDAVQLLQEFAYRTVNLDVTERYGVRNVAAASQFLTRCLASSGGELSVNRAAGALRSAGHAVSRATLSSLLGYYEDAYLCFRLPEHGTSLSANTRAASKVYAVDPGMLTAFSPSASIDEGQRLETAVWCRLRREAGPLRAGALSRLLVREGGGREVDFALGDALLGGGHRLVQATVSLSDPRTRAREIEGLRAGMRSLGEREGWVVTMDEREEVAVPEGSVHVVPAWEWLLG